MSISISDKMYVNTSANNTEPSYAYDDLYEDLLSQFNLDDLKDLTPWELDLYLNPPSAEEKIINYIYVYGSPIILFIATLGNTLALFVLSKLSKQLLSSCLYLSVVCVSDLIQLYIHLGNEWLIHLIRTDLSTKLMNGSEVLCKLEPFITDLTIQLSKWLLVSVSLENLLAVRAPARAHASCTHERSRAVIMLLVVLLSCVNVHYFWSYDIIEMNDKEEYRLMGPMCTFSRYGHVQSQEFVEFVWPLLSLLVAEILPTITVLICTILSISAICHGRHHGTEAYRRWQAKYTLDPDALQSARYMLTGLGICYVLANVPTLVFHAFTYVQTPQPDTIKQQIIRMIGFVFLSSKLFIYITWRRFRRDLKVLLCNRCSSKLAKNKTTPNHIASRVATEPPLPTVAHNNRTTHTQSRPTHPRYNNTPYNDKYGERNGDC